MRIYDQPSVNSRLQRHAVRLRAIPFTLITLDIILAPYLNREAGWRARARFVSKEIG
jgi:hypothetical protein